MAQSATTATNPNPSAMSDRCLNITSLEAKDIRWPTSLGAHGSDAMVCA